MTALLHFLQPQVILTTHERDIMGALPKNKITRAERGKRRAGNTPSLKKQVSHTRVPAHKQGIVAQIFKTIGLSLNTK
jgi:hypothetical protein